MRTYLIPLFVLAAYFPVLLHAQDTPVAPPIIIKPNFPGQPAEPNPPGVIVIRPKAQPAPIVPQTPDTPDRKAPDAAPAPDKTDGTTLFEYWFVAAVEGQRIGYLHWVGREIDKNGKKLWHGSKHQHFTLDRFGQVITQWGEESTVETSEGEVLMTSMRQGLGKDQALALSGMVEGKMLVIRGEGAAAGAGNTSWPGGVTGIAREPKLFKEKNLKVGESFTYLTYIPQVNRVAKTTTTLDSEETTALWPNTPPRKLLKFVSKVEPIGNVKLPPAVVWCDAGSGDPLRVEFDFPGLGGRVTFLRTTKEAATAPVTDPVKLFNAQSILLNRAIEGVHERESIAFRISMPKDDDPRTAFATDSRQILNNWDEKAKTFELHLSARHGHMAGAVNLPAPPVEFLGSSYFINWENEGVKTHARAALAALPAQASNWEKSVAIERWVKRNMKAMDFSQAMATSDQVAKNLSGDCTEYAMLAAAMCRASGIPSRTVLGLVYAAGPNGKSYLAYHMWLEVFCRRTVAPSRSDSRQGRDRPWPYQNHGQ